MRRAEWSEAQQVLKAGLAVHDFNDGWALLARAALETADYDHSMRAWARAGSELQGQLPLQRVHVLALERAGRIDEARIAVTGYERLHPGGDVVLDAVRERLDAPPPDTMRSAWDPFLTVERAERYAAVGRTDRAIRVYRRILYRYPDDLAIRSRLQQLDLAGQEEPETTDLSEELPDPTLVPPSLTIPAPAITSASVEPVPQRTVQPGRHVAEPSFTPPEPLPEPDPDEAPTSVEAIVPDSDDGDATPPPGPQRKHTPQALEEFMQSARDAARQNPDEDLMREETEETEELPGLAEMGMTSTKRRKKRRSLLKR